MNVLLSSLPYGVYLRHREGTWVGQKDRVQGSGERKQPDFKHIQASTQT